MDNWWEDEDEYDLIKDNNSTLFVESLASCHSVTYVHGELIGDPLDVKMF